MADMTPSERRDYLVARRVNLVKRIVKNALAKHGGDPVRGAAWCRRRAERFRRSAARMRREARRRRVEGDPAVVDVFRDMWLLAVDELTCRERLERLDQASGGG